MTSSKHPHKLHGHTPKATYRAPYGYVRVSAERLPLAANNRKGELRGITIQIASRPGYGGDWVRRCNAANGVGSQMRRKRDKVFA